MSVISYDERNPQSHRFKVTFNVDSTYICNIERKSLSNCLYLPFLCKVAVSLNHSLCHSTSTFVCIFQTITPWGDWQINLYLIEKYEIYAHYIIGSTFGKYITLKEQNHNPQLNVFGLFWLHFVIVISFNFSVIIGYKLFASFH